MKTISLLFIPSFFLIIGCGSSDVSKKTEAVRTEVIPVRDSTSVLLKPVHPTAIKPNGTFVTIVVDSLVLIDEYRYRLFGKMITAIQEFGMESFGEPNQRIEATPEYFLNETGLIAFTDERNRLMLELRKAKKGDAFMGSISLHVPGGWVITRVDDIMSTK